jgi:hypothetical protein
MTEVFRRAFHCEFCMVSSEYIIIDYESLSQWVCFFVMSDEHSVQKKSSEKDVYHKRVLSSGIDVFDCILSFSETYPVLK